MTNDPRGILTLALDPSDFAASDRHVGAQQFTEDRCTLMQFIGLADAGGDEGKPFFLLFNYIG